MISQDDKDGQKNVETRLSYEDRHTKMIEGLKKVEAVAAEERRLLGELRKKLETEQRDNTARRETDG